MKRTLVKVRRKKTVSRKVVFFLRKSRKAVSRRKSRKAVPSRRRKKIISRKKTSRSLRKPSQISQADGEVLRILHFDHPKPFEVLGPRLLPREQQVVIRAFLPRAVEAWIRTAGVGAGKFPMKKIHPAGFFQVVFEKKETFFPYRIGFRDEAGYSQENEDPYAFPVQISDFDLHLLGEGNHHRIYEKLGALFVTVNGVPGVHFAVWAPQARSVSVVGNFNHWRTGSHPMTRVRFSGVWALFVPGLKEGEVYKFAVKTSEGRVLLKSDPYAYYSEKRPRTASIATSLKGFSWQDQKWMQERPQRNFLNEPLAVYEVHLGSWKRDGKREAGFLSYKELAHQLVEYVKSMGYTHIQLLPVMEHPLDASWGYQVINYYAPTSRFGTPQDFMYFIDHCHRHGIGVIIDWVPGHFPKDEHGLSNFDGRQLYAYQSWKKAEHREWGTLVFDYGKPEVRNFLISNALFWLDKYHVDGLRVDAVASMLYLDYSRQSHEWEPNFFGGRENLEAIDFLKRFNEIVHGHYPGVLTIAEESTAWTGVSRPTYLGGLGFSLKWNMGWMHDTLEYFSKDPVHRQFHQNMLTFSLLYAFTENFVLPISHDEVVHGKRALLEKMPGDDWQKFANTRLFLGFMYAHPGKKHLFMTADIGQRREWTHDESMDWHLLQYQPHRELQLFLKDLNSIYRTNRALYEVDFDPSGFEWVDFNDAASSIVNFIRWSRDRKQALICTFNMTPVPRYRYRIGVPWNGYYEEILNSDAQEYGGSGMGNLGGVRSDPVAHHGRSYSIEINLPPLAVNIFRFRES